MFAAVIGAVVAVGVLASWWSWRSTSSEAEVQRLALDAAALAWGAAFLAGTLLGDAPTRIFSLRLFGSTFAVASLLEWLALALAVAALMATVAIRLRGRLRDASVAVAAVLFTCLLAEGAMRAYTLAFPTTHGYNTYSNEIWYRRFRRLNSLGFRDVEPALARREGVRRIVLIGDSFAFANGVDRLEDRFGEQLGAILSERTGGGVEVFNASRGNTHTLDHQGMLERMLPFRPDLVVLLYVFNDAEYLKPRKRVVSAAAGLRADFRVGWNPVALLMRNSYLFQELYLRTVIVGYRRAQVEENLFDAYADSALVQRHLVDLATFVAQAQTGGAEVRIVPFDIGVVADDRLRRRDERFLATAIAAGLPLCPILDAFEGVPLRALTVNALDLHPNELGNRLAAQAAAPCIAQALDGPTRPNGQGR